MKISACLITLNEERNLPRALASVAPLVDEILIVDSVSTDGTLQIAHDAGARIIVQPWLGYVAQKNLALDHATHPWVLSLDADEEISPTLAASIRALKENPALDLQTAPNGYTVGRLVFYRERWIRHGDWYPDHLVRLFRRNEARFTGGHVHEKLDITGEHPLLAGHLHHYTYTSPKDRAARCAKYAALWAQTAHEAGRSAALWTGPLHALARFGKGYFLKRGFLDGAVGYDIARGNAREVAMKYRLLRALAR